MGRPATSLSRVSVCICTYNGAPVVARAIRSALTQSVSPFEVLVVDDASSDDTVAIANAFQDHRLRVIENPVNLGNGRNRSRAISLSRGEYIKFVDQDDWLAENCIQKHLDLMEAHPSVGLTFSRRNLALVNANWQTTEWANSYRNLHLSFGSLSRVNDGGEMLRTYVAGGIHGNWIGEPTCVMLRRTVLVQSRLFHRFLRQHLDVDLWVRVMAFAAVGFLDEELATRSVHGDSETTAIRSQRADWLDRLWMLEGLRQFAHIWARYPGLAQLRAAERKSALAALTTGRFRTSDRMDAVKDVLQYAACLPRTRERRLQMLFDQLPEGG